MYYSFGSYLLSNKEMLGSVNISIPELEIIRDIDIEEMKDSFFIEIFNAEEEKTQIRLLV